jgi:Lrp/AsnC family transcriptional regulator for asnA, asnC and gidA
MDELDRRLLIELQKDPRISNARLAKMLGITEPTVSRRIERLVSDTDLVFTALPDMRLFGFNTSAYVALKVKQPSKIAEIATLLSESPQLRAVSTCEGFADIFAGGDFKSTDEFTEFITDYLGKINGISQLDTMVELKRIKQRSCGRIGIRGSGRLTTLEKGAVTIDDVDRDLIFALQKDCRAPLKKLASEVNISEPTVYRRIQNLISSGAIELTTVTNMRKIGYTANGVIGIRADLSKILNVAKAVSQHTQVEYVGIFSGPIQILAGYYAQSCEELAAFATQTLAQTKGVIRIDWLIHSKIFKRNLSWLRKES